MSIDRVNRTVQIFSQIGCGCDHSGESIGGAFSGDDGAIDGSINHDVEAHGYRLLHVGTQTTRDNDGNVWHNTVALLGHNDPPAVKPMS